MITIDEYNREYKKSLQLNKLTEEFKKILEEVVRLTSNKFAFNCYLKDCRRFAMDSILNLPISDMMWGNVVDEARKLIGRRWKQTSSFRMRPIEIERILKTL
jgi:hypothetical protein